MILAKKYLAGRSLPTSVLELQGCNILLILKYYSNLTVFSDLFTYTY